MDTAPTVVEVDRLTKRYGDVIAVNQLSFSVPRGGVFGLLGPNGSGKTTTMGMLLGLVAPTSGTMRLFGQGTATHHEAALHRMGAIVEMPAFYPFLSGRDNLRFFQGIRGQVTSGGIDRLLKMVDLQVRADHKFATYSLGMKQRLGIAYTLIGDPELVFLDEPTNGLDPAGVAEVRALIRSLGTEGRTVVLSSHLLYEVEQVCDSVAILSKGTLIAQGRVQDLLRQKDQVRLHTTDDAQAARVLEALDWVGGIARDGNRLIVTAPVQRAWELTKALGAAEIYVDEMAPVQASLEQYFLEITGEPDATKEPV